MPEINCADFHLLLPDGAWANHSTSEAYDYQLSDAEQLMVVIHIPRATLEPNQVQEAVTELFRVRLEVIQKHLQNACNFESPVVSPSPNKFDAFVIGHDLRSNVFMHLGFYGRPDKILVVSYYDYTGSRSIEEFRARTQKVLDSVEVK